MDTGSQAILLRYQYQEAGLELMGDLGTANPYGPPPAKATVNAKPSSTNNEVPHLLPYRTELQVTQVLAVDSHHQPRHPLDLIRSGRLSDPTNQATSE